jgi:hypothetical protein
MDVMSVELATRLRDRVDAALRLDRQLGHDPRRWIGLGLEDVPGKPFGWAFNAERRALLEHLQRKDDGTLRGAHRAWGTHRGRGYTFIVTKLQERLHRQHPTYRDRQAAWKLRMGLRQPNPTPTFTEEELAMIAERFSGANDPIGQSIEQKARSYVR